MFDLIADIERYPEFLQGWVSARVRGREGNVVQVDQVVGFGPVRLKFASQAVLERPHRVDVTSTDPTFRKYGLFWSIAAIAAGCRIDVVAELEFQSGFFQFAMERFLPNAIGGIVTAFEARAHTLYDPHT